MKIAVVGATGLVGRDILKVLEERNIQVTEFFPVASSKSTGKKITFSGKEYSIISIEDAVEKKPDIAIFFGRKHNIFKSGRQKFADVGTKVIDNSSAWRMNNNIPLIVPEN